MMNSFPSKGSHSPRDRKQENHERNDKHDGLQKIKDISAHPLLKLQDLALPSGWLARLSQHRIHIGSGVDEVRLDQADRPFFVPFFKKMN